MSTRFIESVKSLTDLKNKRWAVKFPECSERAKNVAYLHMQLLVNDASLLSSLVLDVSETIIVHSGDAFLKGRKEKYISDGVQDRISRLLDIAIQMLFIGVNFGNQISKNASLSSKKFEEKVEDVVRLVRDVFMSQSQEEFESKCNDILAQLNGVRTRLKLYPYISANVDVDLVLANLTIMSNGGRMLHENCIKVSSNTNARVIKPTLKSSNNSKEFANEDEDEGGVAVEIVERPKTKLEKRQTKLTSDSPPHQSKHSEPPLHLQNRLSESPPQRESSVHKVKKSTIPARDDSVKRVVKPVTPDNEYDSNANIESLQSAPGLSKPSSSSFKKVPTLEKSKSATQDPFEHQDENIEQPTTPEIEYHPAETPLAKEAISLYKSKLYQEAKEQFLVLAKENNPVAFYYIGLMTWHGQCVEKSTKKAVQWFERSLALNYAPAMTALAVIYLDDKDLFDVKKGCKLMSDAANLNEPEALAKMGFFNHVGLYFNQNLKSANSYYQKLNSLESSEEGNSSLIHCAIMYIYGQGVERDFKTAMELLTKSAAQKNPFGMSFLGYMYANGIGVATDLEKSAKWYTRCAKYGGTPVETIQAPSSPKAQHSAPVQANPQAPILVQAAQQPAVSVEELFILGISYLKGINVACRVEKGIFYLEQAVLKESPQALFELGKFYSESQSHGNPTKAHSYLMKAAQLGVMDAMPLIYRSLDVRTINANNIDHYMPILVGAANNGNTEVMNWLGQLYESGKLKPASPQKALQYYELSAMRGNVLGCYKAGSMILENTEESESSTILKAMNYLENSAKMDNVNSLVRLAQIYQFGEFNNVMDEGRAFDYYKRAAMLGSAEAMCKCGVMLHYGQGIPQNYKLAHDYYIQAAGFGNQEAMINLQTIYQYGQGVQRDSKRANEWAVKSLARNETMKP
eukprot:NODE_329_length_10886_cov_0.296653.p1 type:complete len:915 gc:universal NODE_329_length_10886_cov_0.296653:440-3184(+)